VRQKPPVVEQQEQFLQLPVEVFALLHQGL
jgi:hypothetical protein